MKVLMRIAILLGIVGVVFLILNLIVSGAEFSVYFTNIVITILSFGLGYSCNMKENK